MISKKHIDGGRSFDWGITAQQYAKYRNIYPQELYDRLRVLGVAANDTAWLDIGTGTGILPQNLYNPQSEIVGVDISEEQIRCARETAVLNSWKIKYLVAPAENTGLPEDHFHCITAAQCFWYFERDRIKSEIIRMLKRGGKFIKIYLTYTLDDEIANNSHCLIKQYNPEWEPGDSGYEDMYDDLFEGRITETFYAEIPFTHETWHGRMCACRGTLASMNKELFDEWSEAHKNMLQLYPEAFTIKHKVYITYFEL